MSRIPHDGSPASELTSAYPTNERPSILCLAHLGWDYVWQRPQHILSRLGRRYPVLYVNEPEIVRTSQDEPQLKLISAEGNLKAWQPFFADVQSSYDNWRQLYLNLIKDLLLREGWLAEHSDSLKATRPLIFWFYTPIPYYILDHLEPDLVVYDIMDDLASFKGAAHNLRERETALLRWADIAFAGGQTLYQARKAEHNNLHLYPSGVEVEHFKRAQDPGTPVADEVAQIPQPILGYYGAIDERIDLALIQTVAREHPEWSIVLIGPTRKIEKNQLPREPNIYYLGLQPYERLPNFLKAFTVCLMPFALNEATQAISPTKTLEYMAAHKPIVSTPVLDVVRNWGDVVYIADGPKEFANAIARVLQESEQTRMKRQQGETNHLANSSWDLIAAQMEKRVLAALENVRMAKGASQEDAP